MTEITCTNWDSPGGRPYTAVPAELSPLLIGEGRLWLHLAFTRCLNKQSWYWPKRAVWFQAEFVLKAGILCQMALYLLIQHVLCWHTVSGNQVHYLVSILGPHISCSDWQEINYSWNLGQEACTFIYKGEVHYTDISISTFKMRKLRFRDVCDQVTTTGANMMRETQIQN